MLFTLVAESLTQCIISAQNQGLIRGLAVLLKSTLASLLVFMLSIFVIPCSIEDEIERLMWNSLWGSTVEKRKFHLLA